MSKPETASMGPGRPKDPAKRAAILDAAKRLFIRQGYGKSSMSAIAAEAGVSKLTLYSHFADKEALFAAAIKAKCEEQLPPLVFELSEHSPIRTVLLGIGRGFYALINSAEAIALKRLMIAQANIDSGLSRLFHEAGPQRVLEGMERLLASAHASGVLHTPRPRVAAEQFFSLVMGAHHYRLLSGVEPPQDPAVADAHVQDVVDLFLQVYQNRFSTP